MAKWYYHPIYKSERALNAARDHAALSRVGDFNQDPDYASGGRVVYCHQWRPGKPLRRVVDGDVVTVDGHGRANYVHLGYGLYEYQVGPDLANHPGDGSRTHNVTISPNDVADRMKSDGFRNNRVLVKLYACFSGLSPHAGGDPTAKILAMALDYSNVVVQGYTGLTRHTDEGRLVGGKPAHEHRNYFDSKGRELSTHEAIQIAGNQVAHKEREGLVDL